jgi:benzoyl-CoA reductase/2-hydroxyglutaryl-CoA dehydratase subunit BcrC/BadD/HgdB
MVMKRLKHIEFFESLLHSSRNELVGKALEQGRVPIGYNCYLVPEPLLSMGKAFPVRIRAGGVSSTEIATHYMSPYICSYARSVLEHALDGGLDFLGGLVYATCCIHITRCFHNLELLNVNAGKPDYFTFAIDTPRKISENWIGMLAKNYRKATQRLTDHYGIDTGDNALGKAIREHNEFNSLLRKLSDLRKADEPKITGTEFHIIMVASKIAPHDMLLEPLKKVIAEVEKRPGIKGYRARLMVLGSIFDNPGFTELIEEQGALVVADRYCFGSLPGLEPIKENGDPYENLARHYLETCACPRMMEKLEERDQSVMQWAEEFKADGIVFETMKFCDLWGYEALNEIPKLRQSALPMVRIEREYALSGEGQLRTRFQAFIEVIENKRLNKSLAGKGAVC